MVLAVHRRVPVHHHAPFLDRWGAPLLFGPGSILVAHTSDEHLALDELDRAIDVYEQLALACLEARAQPVSKG